MIAAGSARPVVMHNYICTSAKSMSVWSVAGPAYHIAYTVSWFEGTAVGRPRENAVISRHKREPPEVMKAIKGMGVFGGAGITTGRAVLSVRPVTAHIANAAKIMVLRPDYHHYSEPKSP